MGIFKNKKEMNSVENEERADNLSKKQEEKLAKEAQECNNLGVRYYSDGMYEEAKNSVKEAIEKYGELTANNPEYIIYLANSYRNLAAILNYNNEFDQAEKAYLNVLTIFKELYDGGAQKYLSDVAYVCSCLADLYAATGKNNLAERMYLDTINLYAAIADMGTRNCAEDIAKLAYNLGIFYISLNRKSDAEIILLQALDIYRDFAEKEPAQYMSCLTDICYKLAEICMDTNRFDEARKLYEEPVGRYRKLAELAPDLFMVDLAATCDNLGYCFYYKVNRFDEAVRCTGESIQIYRKLSEKNPDEYMPNIAPLLCNLGDYYSKANEEDKAKEHYKKALETARKYSDDSICKRIIEIFG